MQLIFSSSRFREYRGGLLVSLTLLLAAGGCIPSLHPLYNDETVERDEIVGRWKGSVESQVWEFTQATEGGYVLDFTDKERRTAKFSVHLTEVNDALFMDLFPMNSDAAKPGFYNLHFVQAHTFYRLRFADRTLTLSFLNPQWLKQLQREKPGDLSHVRRDESVLLTADTESLRRFVASHLDTEDAFSKPFTLRKESK